VLFKNLELKDRVMTNLKNLKETGDEFKSVGIAHDLNTQERQAIRDMVNEVKRKHAAAEADGVENYRFLVIGQGPRRRVIKVTRNS